MLVKIVSNVSLEYLLLFKSSDYCCDGNLLNWHANCTFFVKALLHRAIFSATCLAMVENLALQLAEVWC